MGVTIMDQRVAMDSNDSIQALQTAESGADVLISRIRQNPGGVLEELHDGGCSNGVISGAGSRGSYEVTFFDEDGDQLTNCGTDAIQDIRSVKSVGSYSNVNRAVEVAMAQSGEPGITGGCTLSITLREVIYKWGGGCLDEGGAVGSSSRDRCESAQESGYECGQVGDGGSGGYEYCLCIPEP